MLVVWRDAIVLGLVRLSWRFCFSFRTGWCLGSGFGRGLGEAFGVVVGWVDV